MMKKTLVQICLSVLIAIFVLACHDNPAHQSDTNTTGQSDTNLTGDSHSNNSNENGSNEIPVNKIFGEVQPPKVCSLKNKKQFVYDLFHDSYLWANITKEVDFEDNSTYPDEEVLLKDLRYEKDHFSFIMKKKDYDNFFEAGKNIGFGFEFAFVGDTASIESIIVLLVYPDSPAAKIGLKRSDEILSIDGKSADEIYHDDTLLDHYFYDDKNLSVSIKVRHSDSSVEELNITKKEFDFKTVIVDKVLDIEQKKIGYLLFQSFVGTSEQELDDAFNHFHQEGIDELVLDLRYSGGGYVYIANHLASLIGGYKTAGKVFQNQLFNAKYSNYNDTVYFENEAPQSLALDRVFILTTNNSCSASELVINGLRALVTGIDVVQIGEATCGKPYGMIGGAYCDKYILPVQMKSTNGDNVGDYVDGLTPACSAKDDVFDDFTDQKETLFAQALYYIKNDHCKNVSSRSFVRETIFDRRANFRSRFGIY